LSLKDNTRYIGSSSKSPSSRLQEHNQGSNKFTKNHLPYKLLYYEQGYCKTCALKREKFLKSGQGRQIIDAILQFQPEADQPMAGA